jgi:hypothetical protein
MIARFIYGLLILLAICGTATGQGGQVNIQCLTGSTPPWAPCSASNPLPVSAVITPGGTQNVNLTQVLGAAPSATNPIWVSPATASTPWAVTGTITAVTTITNPVAATQSGTWTVQPGNTANTTAWLVQLAGQSFTNITTNTDTNVKGSPGTLVGLVVNTVGTGSTVQLFNDADGTCSTGLIGTFTTTAQSSIVINAAATVGICAKTAGAGAADITVLFR